MVSLLLQSTVRLLFFALIVCTDCRNSSGTWAWTVCRNWCRRGGTGFACWILTRQVASPGKLQQIHCMSDRLSLARSHPATCRYLTDTWSRWSPGFVTNVPKSTLDSIHSIHLIPDVAFVPSLSFVHVCPFSSSRHIQTIQLVPGSSGSLVCFLILWYNTFDYLCLECWFLDLRISVLWWWLFIFYVGFTVFAASWFAKKTGGTFFGMLCLFRILISRSLRFRGVRIFIAETTCFSCEVLNVMTGLGTFFHSENSCRHNWALWVGSSWTANSFGEVCSAKVP